MTQAPGPSLSDWLDRLNALDPTRIELGLDRVRPVAEALGVLAPRARVVTVAGTNGKGSTVALAEAVALAAGQRVGTYTSPHILEFNERVRINGCDATDAEIVSGLAAVESARGQTPLTYFEFITLAALWCFSREPLDLWLLEVGLGGRLDVVNVVDPDVAVITSIGLDHMDWLGPNRDAIAQEKAGILRPGRPVICGEADPPPALQARLEAHDGPVLRADAGTLSWTEQTSWSLRIATDAWDGLPPPGLVGVCSRRNAAVAVAALRSAEIPMTHSVLQSGLMAARIRGRLETIATAPEVLVDTAHNAQAAGHLADSLAALPPMSGSLHCVLSMLSDKDATAVVEAFRLNCAAGTLCHWYFAASGGPRGQSAERLSAQAGVDGACYADVGDALDAARAAAGDDGRVVCFGSFLTVEFAIRHVHE